MSRDFSVKFWGVRGSCPTPGKKTIIYGGNTPCIEVAIGDRILIMDAGTGIRKLGLYIQQNNNELNIDIFITHTHWDHIQGLPFFSPIYKPNNKFTIYGYKDIGELITWQFQKNFFPIQFNDIKSKIEFKILKDNSVVNLDDNIRVTTMLTNHGGKNLAYKVESYNKTLCYLGDFEHSEKKDSTIIDFVKGADLIIYDAKYTDEEYLNYKSGRGHSTWQEGIKLAKAAKADKLALFHHSPFRSDKELKKIEKLSQTVYKDALVAKEGMVINL
jgi:phosphoribosyl 1,2-cyclic phosphodiesterase